MVDESPLFGRIVTIHYKAVDARTRTRASNAPRLPPVGADIIRPLYIIINEHK